MGGDENSARDMGIAIDAADRVRRASGGTSLLVHHDTKEGGSPRGSSAFLGNLDTVIEAKADGDQLTLRCEKQKDAERFAPPRFAVVKQDKSCLLGPSNWTGSQSSTPAVSDALDGPLGRAGLSGSDIEKVTGLPRSTVHYALNGLLEDGDVVKGGTDARPLYRPAGGVDGD